MQKEFNELSSEIRLARLAQIDSDENLKEVPAETRESWSSYLGRPFSVVFGVFSSTGTLSESERLQRMKEAGGDGSWRL